MVSYKCDKTVGRINMVIRTWTMYGPPLFTCHLVSTCKKRINMVIRTWTMYEPPSFTCHLVSTCKKRINMVIRTWTLSIIWSELLVKTFLRMAHTRLMMIVMIA